LLTTLAGNYVNQTTANTLQAISVAAPQRRRRPASFSQALAVGLESTDSDDRQILEASIAQKFDQQYNAQIHHFLPHLLSLSESEELGAVVGVGLAGQSELFLERYLDTTVEQAVSQAVRAPIDRGQVVEIGNLAAAVPGTASLLFAVLATILHRAGIRWVVCTATPQVKTMLGNMRFPIRTICDADIAAMGDQADEWGDYYASRPQVIVGDTRHAAEAVSSSRLMSALIRKLESPINRIAANLKAAR
jgi:hypothetical protein